MNSRKGLSVFSFAAGMTALPQTFACNRTARVLFFAILSVLMMAFTLSGHAQNTRWNGSHSSDWFDVRNWDNGVPGPTGDASISWISSGNQWPVINGNTSFRSLTMASNNNALSIMNGSEVNISQNVSISNTSSLTAGNVSLHVGGNFFSQGSVSWEAGGISTGGHFTSSGNSTTIDLGDADLSVSGNVSVTGISTFGNGTIDVSGSFAIGNNQEIHINGGTLNIRSSSSLGGKLFIDGGAEVNTWQTFTVGASSQLILLDGDINFSGNTFITGNATFYAGQGNIYFGDNVTLAGSGRLYAEESSIVMEGESWSMTGGSNFDPGTSTFTFSGGSQSVTGAWGINEIRFHNLVLENESTVNSSIGITTYNDMSIEAGSLLQLATGRNLNVVGRARGVPFVSTNRPFVVSASVSGTNTIQVVFNEPLIRGTAQNRFNYRIVDALFGGNQAGNILSASLGGANNNIVTLTLSADAPFSAKSEADYYLASNNVANLNGGTVNPDHMKLLSTEAQTTYTVSGTITSGGSPLSGVNVVASGDHSQNVTTNASGQFTFTNVPAGAHINITPSFSNYEFLPASLLLSNIEHNISGADFIAKIPGVSSVTGRVLSTLGHPVGGVTLTARGDHKQTVTSNQSGFYQFYGISGTNNRFYISPELTGYTFDPDSIYIDHRFNPGQGYHVDNQDFTAIPGILPYFSRQNGSWNVASTWSNTGHSGAAAPQPPGPDDEAVIGDGHIVTLTSDISSNLTGKVTVNPAGTLVSNQFVISGSGSFVLNPGGTLHIGSAQGILASGNGGNIRTANRSFSTQAGYVYDGIQAQQTGDGLPAEVFSLRIDNPSGVSASGSLRVSDQLQLDNGLLIMPPGSSLAAANTSRTNGNVRMQLSIQGGKGWRMISSPVNTNYSDLLDGFVSQGFPGSSSTDLQTNLMWFDETESGTTNMAWRAPGALSDNVQGGRGHFFYIFNGEGGYSDMLPITMDATGIEFITGSASFDFNVTRTPRTDVEDTETEALNAGWNLIGNPSTATLNWDAVSGWTKSNIDNTFYVWDPAANGGMGDFKYWNGTDGTLGNGLIAPFQAFWVRANTFSPALRVNALAKTTGATFVGNPSGKSSEKSDKEETPSALQLRLTAGDMEASSLITFCKDGHIGEDRKDAYRLEAMNDSWLKLFTTTGSQHLPMVINNLPLNFGELIHLPLYAAGQREGESLGGSYKLLWQLPPDWPAHWDAYLMDHQQKTSIPMQEAASEVIFELTGSTANKTKKTEGVFLPSQIISDKPEQAGIGYQPDDPQKSAGTQATSELRTSQVSGAPRFSIVIFSNKQTADVAYMPAEPVFFPVFPNPVKDQAGMAFNLPAAERVSIEVYNIQGKLIEVITDQTYEAGIHHVSWTPHSMPEGIYIAVMRTYSQLLHQKMILIH